MFFADSSANSFRVLNIKCKFFIIFGNVRMKMETILYKERVNVQSFLRKMCLSKICLILLGDFVPTDTFLSLSLQPKHMIGIKK